MYIDVFYIHINKLAYIIEVKIHATLIFLLLSLQIFCQENKDFVILTFIEEDKGGRHAASTHYWITKLDSVSAVDYKVPLFPTYLRTEYSNDCLKRCCEGEKIDLLTSTTRTEYNYPEKHIEQSENLLKLVNNNREFLQKVRITWGERKIKRLIKVYGTPIKGKFCECGIYGLSLRFADGKQKVLLPNGKYELIQGFWKSDLGQFIKFYDFSKVNPQNAL